MRPAQRSAVPRCHVAQHGQLSEWPNPAHSESPIFCIGKADARGAVRVSSAKRRRTIRTRVGRDRVALSAWNESEESWMSTTEAPKKTKKVYGEVYIDRERCKGCSFCIEFCPTHCLELDQAFNAKGYHPPVLARPDDCNGCDLCGLYCPDFAIFAVMIKAKKG
jgi:2-oxoglutarate ferredoxin oxidoreductase subunit delta